MNIAQKMKKYCHGCHNDFYNGHNELGITMCWSLKDSKVVWKKKVHIDQVPPWNQKPMRVLSCYRQPRYVFVGPKQTY